MLTLLTGIFDSQQAVHTHTELLKKIFNNNNNNNIFISRG